MSWPEALELLSAELGEPVSFRVAADRQFLERLTSAGVPAGTARLLVTREWAILACYLRQAWDAAPVPLRKTLLERVRQGWDSLSMACPVPEHPSDEEYAGYALLTLATMTKGPVAPVLVGLFIGFGYTLGPHARERLARLHWIRGLAAALLAASPWFIWMSFHFGDRFLNDYLLAGNVWYFTQPTRFSSREKPCPSPAYSW